jgi:hypothetical protein
MEFRSVYDQVSRWVGWAGWVAVVIGALYVNAVHPFIDQGLIVLVWPIVAGITVRPLIRLCWPVLVLSGAGVAAYAPAGAFALALARKLL